MDTERELYPPRLHSQRPTLEVQDLGASSVTDGDLLSSLHDVTFDPEFSHGGG